MSRFGTFYEWSDHHDEACVSFYIPPNKSKKDIAIIIKNDQICAGIKGQTPIVQGTLFEPVMHSLWFLSDGKVSIDLEKKRKTPWPMLVKGPVLKGEDIDGQSQYEFAQAKIHGRHFEVDLREGFRNMLAAAKKGLLLAQKGAARVYLGLDKKFLDILKTDATKALDFLKMANKQWNDPEAQLMIGHVYFNGTAGIEQDLFISEEWYSKAAKQGVPIAFYHLGLVAFKRGEYPTAQKLWIKAKDLNCSEACLRLCRMFIEGKVVPKDLKQAREYLRSLKRTPATEPEAIILEERINELEFIDEQNRKKESTSLSRKAIAIEEEAEEDQLSPLAALGLLSGAAVAVVGAFMLHRYIGGANNARK